MRKVLQRPKSPLHHTLSSNKAYLPITHTRQAHLAVPYRRVGGKFVVRSTYDAGDSHLVLTHSRSVAVIQHHRDPADVRRGMFSLVVQQPDCLGIQIAQTLPSDRPIIKENHCFGDDTMTQVAGME